MPSFQARFRSWLGPDPHSGAVVAAELSGYSVSYVRWAAGLIGKKKWVRSRKFIKAMTALGCTNKRWRDRSPEQLRQAFKYREVLYDPLKEP